MTDLSHDTGEDGFHEIQLSGKQLVFLFMVTTVISVVIFLCGVLVGRSVKGDTVNAADPMVTGAQPSPVVSEAPTPTTPPATPHERDLSYARRLEGEKPVKEELKPSGESKPAASEPKPVAPQPAEPAPAPAPASAPASTATSATTPRSGTWAVQVVALTDRSAANAVVQRLAGKGYPAFLVSPQAGAPVQNYKVQVGRYADRAEAEQIKNRLKKEEQFEPWILR